MAHSNSTPARPRTPEPRTRRPRSAYLAALVFCVCLGLAGGSTPLRAQSTADTDPLRRLNSSVETLIKKVSPSVVQILVSGYGQVEPGDRSNTDVIIGPQRAIGSGFIIDSSGYIITNAHVVAGAENVQVVLSTDPGDSTPSSSLAFRGDIVPATVVGVARDIDLAVLKIDRKNLPSLPIANYAHLRQGELVFAFGSPGGLRNSVSMGVVSATARQTDPDSPFVYIQTDAPINPGNSGGPLVNVNGEVVGVNTFILSQSGGNEGLGFAIPSAIVTVSFQQIRKLGHVHRGEIGLGLQTISPPLASALNLPRKYGVVVSDVLPRSPADAAGIRIQDVLDRVDGQPVDSLPYFVFRLMTHDAGDKVHIEVLRGSDHLSFDVPIVEPPHEIDQLASRVDPEKSLVRPLGILGIEIDDKIASELADLRDSFGILVAARSSQANSAIPLNTGDVIRTLNGVPMTTLAQLREAIRARQPGAPLVFQIQRDERLLFVVINLE